LIFLDADGVLAQAAGGGHLQELRTPFEPTEEQLSLLNLSPHDLGTRF